MTKFKTPKFWSTKHSLISNILLPIAGIYWIVAKLRNVFTKTYSLNGKFVICVGNATIGGSGKTPLSIAIYKELKKEHSVCFLTKGYGRITKGFIKAKESDDFKTIGDEAKILQKHGQVYLCKNYFEAVKNLHQIKENIIIMDDGLQNLTIKKNFSILLIDATKLQNQRLFPAGSMRESLNFALKKAHCVIGYGENFPSHLPYFQSHLEYSCQIVPQSVVAFSGLGNNEKFRKSATENGFNVVKFFEFSDHYPYKKKDLQKIIQTAQKMELKIITTEKDFVKLPKHFQKMVSIFYVNCNVADKTFTFIKEHF